MAYAIGKVKPISILLDTFGTGTMSDEELLDIVKKNFNFEVKNLSRIHI